MKECVKTIIQLIQVETGINFNKKDISEEVHSTNQNGDEYVHQIVPIMNREYGLVILRCGCKGCDNILHLEVLYHHTSMEKNAGRIADMIRDAVGEFDITVQSTKC